ncbi:G patch domain-containing protein 4 [Halichoeres trimaculatus]|uniref:G patch domain-containing protein 4 n=1 Tax=Halichoeres trimaculatus TaxID=147232 RepID=UPI003D9E3FE1
MAEAVQEKTRGLKFAEQQLLRHGWEQGKGLGRAENGISEAIKVKVKCDKGGVGHKEGEQFTFHWWDHVFNKASSSLQVESDVNGIKLKKTATEEEEEGMISNKRPRKAALAKAKLYGCFVKSATLLSGQEQPEPKASNSDSSSSDSEEEDQRLDLSSTTNLSDAELMKACGGRTAHKGARHGLTMSAKLARLEQQEAEFMARYGKKKQPAHSSSPVCTTPTLPTSLSPERAGEKQEEKSEDSQRKKVKKKRPAESFTELNGAEASETPETEMVPKKKKKKKSKEDIEAINGVSTEEDVICEENDEADKTKRKHKKRRNNTEQIEEEGTPSPAAESPVETTELHCDTKVKKKKKKSRHQSEAAEEEDSKETECSQSETLQDSALKQKKTKCSAVVEDAEVMEEESTMKQNRKKSKKDKTSIGDIVNEETLPPKKKKKKSKELC